MSPTRTATGAVAYGIGGVGMPPTSPPPLLEMGLATVKWVARNKSEQNRTVLDPWTAVHFAAGLAAGLTRIPLRWSLGLAITYELVEQVFERQETGKAFFKVSGPEVAANVLMDVAVFALGARAGERWNQTEVR